MKCTRCGAAWTEDELLAEADMNEDDVVQWMSAGLCGECFEEVCEYGPLGAGRTTQGFGFDGMEPTGTHHYIPDPYSLGGVDEDPDEREQMIRY